MLLRSGPKNISPGFPMANALCQPLLASYPLPHKLSRCWTSRDAPGSRSRSSAENFHSLNQEVACCSKFLLFPARKGDAAFIWRGCHYRFIRVSPCDLRISVVRGSRNWSRSSRNQSQKPGPSSDEPEIIMLREFSRKDYLPSEPSSPLTVVSSHAGAVH